MKARINESNQITVVSELPNKFGNTVGGYNKLPESVHRADGWRDVVVPEYNPVLQRLGELYFDTENDVFTYPVINLTFDFEAEKAAKIKQAKQRANTLLQPTDWYVIRQMERNEAIPENVATNRLAIVTRCNQIEGEISALTNITDVLMYQIDFNI
ncbi:MAG: hypothetical protein RBU23_13035 [Candidatus Auribacterota bacterium]|jgi:hypothetical protein|nr:hypothetical protein [Candidatus Auribacterota bacterium]